MLEELAFKETLRNRFFVQEVVNSLTWIKNLIFQDSLVA